jgi:F-type H+-transporting ATPase subunit epsilon
VALTVQIVTPEREVVVCDDATLVIAKGIEGDVGIMTGHAPLLIALGVGPLTLVREGNRREIIAIDGGFLQVSRDQVIVLAEYAILPEEIDVGQTEAEIAELRQRISDHAEEEEAKRRLARAEMLHAVARM